MSVQYYEAISPAIFASLSSVIVEQTLMTGGVFGGKVYTFPSVYLNAAAFFYAACIGVASGVCAIGIVLGLKGIKLVRVTLGFNPILNLTLAGLILGVLGMLSPVVRLNVFNY